MPGLTFNRPSTVRDWRRSSCSASAFGRSGLANAQSSASLAPCAPLNDPANVGIAIRELARAASKRRFADSRIASLLVDGGFLFEKSGRACVIGQHVAEFLRLTQQPAPEAGDQR